MAIYILGAIIVLLPILYLLIRQLYKYHDRDIVWGYPIIGNLYSMTPTTAIDTVVRYSKKLGPVFDIMVFTKRITIINNIKDAKEILMKRPKVFRRPKRGYKLFDRIGMAKGLLVVEGNDWNKHRRLVAPPFNKQNVNYILEAIWTECFKFAMKLEKYCDENQTVNFVNEAISLTTGVIGTVAFGFSEENGAYFYSPDFVNDMNNMLTYVSERLLFPFPRFIWKMTSKYTYELKAIEAAERVVKFGMSVIKSGKVKHQYNSDHLTFLQSVLRAEENAKLTDEETISNIVTIFAAGTDTTSIGICWTLYYLSLNPSILQDLVDEVDKVREDTPIIEKLNQLKFCSACFKEAMRLKGPVAVVGLELVDKSTKHVLHSGTVIRPLDNVWVPLESFKLDDKVFENAMNFNPYRWLTSPPDRLQQMNQYLVTFGGGPRICPGLELAEAEGVFCIANIVKYYTFSLACPPEDIHRKMAVSVHINKMPMTFAFRS